MWFTSALRLCTCVGVRGGGGFQGLFHTMTSSYGREGFIMENMLPTNKGEQHETLLLQTNSMLDHYDIAYTNAYP